MNVDGVLLVPSFDFPPNLHHTLFRNKPSSPFQIKEAVQSFMKEPFTTAFRMLLSCLCFKNSAHASSNYKINSLLFK